MGISPVPSSHVLVYLLGLSYRLEPPSLQTGFPPLPPSCLLISARPFCSEMARRNSCKRCRAVQEGQLCPGTGRLNYRQLFACHTFYGRCGTKSGTIVPRVNTQTRSFPSFVRAYHDFRFDKLFVYFGVRKFYT